MKSIKCPQCGLTNWETAQWCSRCKQEFKSNGYAAANAGNAQSYNAQSNGNERFSKAFFDDKNGFLAKNIERCQRNVLIVCLLTIVAVISGFFVSGRYLYNAAFVQFNPGYAAAIGIVLFVFTFLLTLVQRRIFGNTEAA